MALLETPKYEKPKVIVESGEFADKKAIEDLSNNERLAKEEADRIIEGLPNTIYQLSPEQQKQFEDLWGEYTKGLDLSFVPKNSENVPDTIPGPRGNEVERFVYVMDNMGKLSPDQQKLIKDANKQAILQLTKDSKNVIDNDKLEKAD